MEKLRNALELYHMNTLKEMARYVHLDTTKTTVRKAWLINELTKKICEHAKSRDYIHALSEPERAVLGVILENNRTHFQRDVALPLMMAGMVYIEGQESTFDRPRIKDILLSLMRKGLVINLTETGAMSTRRTLDNFSAFGLAIEIRGMLPKDILPPPVVNDAPIQATPPPHVEGNDPEQFLRQLFFIWAELRREPAKQLKSGKMAKRDVRRIAKSLGLDVDADRTRLDWMYTIMEALNLVDTDFTTIHATDNKAVTLFWDTTPATQLHDILRLFPRIDLSLSLNTRALSQFAYYSNTPLKSTYEIRRRVLALVEKIAPAHWVPFSMFHAFISGGKYGDLILEEYTLRTLYNNLRWYGTRRREDLEDALQTLEQQAIIIVLKELQSLGIVDLGYNTPGEPPCALQATDLARAHFTKTSFSSAKAEGQIILQPDFQILAMGPVSLSILANLERFAEREKLDESVITYRITKDSAYQAFQREESVQSVQIFLEEATGQPIPQNIQRSLEEWQGQYERIVLRRNVTILQLDNAETLEQLLSDKVIRRYLHRLDDHTGWVHTKNTEKVEKRLWALEMLPAHSNGPQADLPNSLQWNDEHLYARHPLPSLYVTGTIRRVAEQVSGGWQLTQQSVKSATTTGMDIPGIISLVEEMSGSNMPIEWDKRLKAWGKHYGDGQVSQVTLLRLESAQALQELRRSDRRLSRWIRPLPGAEGLGVIVEDHWDEVQTLLAEWGVAIEENNWW